ncbi:MAG TPA: metallophosphoesterase [Lacunisphaera sp.]|nr:metallophosphoesterase [Lacunisphaera sp.]
MLVSGQQMHVNARRCLIIPDIHQDIPWLDRILECETDWDRVVFLGDYFDSKKPVRLRTGVAATCVYLNKLRTELGARAVFLLGNHDIQYLEAKPACDAHRTPRYLLYKCGSAYSHSAATKIAKGLAPGFWAESRLFVHVNGWLISHAGVDARLWPNAPDVGEALGALEREAKAALLSMRRGPHPLLQAGKVRGGEADFGGITWLDWDEEFQDSLPLPQIVGHTSNPLGARQKGRSWCLDGKQSCYGVLAGEELLVRTLP